jgi:hypothetical protein
MGEKVDLLVRHNNTFHLPLGQQRILRLLTQTVAEAAKVTDKQ